jgi:hypothetical protein
MVSLVLASRNGIAIRRVCGLTSRIAEASQGNTSALSVESLVQAASGRASERLLRLVKAVYTGTAAEVREAVLDVVKIGETSGTDLVVGVILGARTAIGLGESAA